jgi:hypothetical protein
VINDHLCDRKQVLPHSDHQGVTGGPRAALDTSLTNSDSEPAANLQSTRFAIPVTSRLDDAAKVFLRVNEAPMERHDEAIAQIETLLR